VKHDPKTRTLGFEQPVLLSKARAVLDAARRAGLGRFNFWFYEGLSKRKSTSVASLLSDQVIDDQLYLASPLAKTWITLSYPKRAPITDEEMILLMMLLPEDLHEV
jgi:hypothetical protein